MTPASIATAADISHWRSEFPIVDTCTYLVSHSLGAMPRKTAAYLQEFAEMWSRRGVRAWHEGWWEVGRETGNLLAPTLGVATNTISMHQNVTVAQGIIASCFTYGGPRRKIVMTELEFPSNHYLFEGFRRYGAEIVYVPSADPIRLDLQRFLDAIDEHTVLVPLSLVLFKSAFITDARVIEKAHRVGAHHSRRLPGGRYRWTSRLARGLRGRRPVMAVRRAGRGYLRFDAGGNSSVGRVGAHGAVRCDQAVRYPPPQRFQAGASCSVPARPARIVASIVPAIRRARCC